MARKSSSDKFLKNVVLREEEDSDIIKYIEGKNFSELCKILIRREMNSSDYQECKDMFEEIKDMLSSGVLVARPAAEPPQLNEQRKKSVRGIKGFLKG